MTIIDIPVRDRIFIALDGNDDLEAKNTVDDMMAIGLTHFKIGKKLIDRGKGGKIAQYIHEWGGVVFWDNKNLDIGNTLAGGVKSSGELGVQFANVMAEAGPRRLKLVQEAAGDVKVMGVTVLTDMSDDECTEVYGAPVAPTVRRFAGFAEEAGLWGLICSAADLTNLAEHGVATKLVKVTPAIRPLWAAANDQARPTTPADAFSLGADYIVVGRPILEPPAAHGDLVIGTPERAVELIIEESTPVLEARVA